MNAESRVFEVDSELSEDAEILNNSLETKQNDTKSNGFISEFGEYFSGNSFFQERNSLKRSEFRSLQKVTFDLNSRSGAISTFETEIIELNFKFWNHLENYSRVNDSIFGMISLNSASFLNKKEFSSSDNSSFFRKLFVLDLLLPEKNRKWSIPFYFISNKFFENQNPMDGVVLLQSRLSFRNLNNRKLMRYYAIRSDGPPYSILKQVCL